MYPSLNDSGFKNLYLLVKVEGKIITSFVKYSILFKDKRTHNKNYLFLLYVEGKVENLVLKSSIAV